MGKVIGNFFIEYLFALILSIGAGFFFWFFEPEETVSMELFFWTIFPLALFSLLLVKFTIQHLQKATSNKLPKLKAVTDNKYIFESSSLFAAQTFASLYFSDDYEKLVALGYVESVLDNKNTLQVVITDFFNGYDHRQVKNDKGRIILKPTIPYPVMQAISLKEGESREQ